MKMCADMQVRGTEARMKDWSGQEWDCVTPAAFHFVHVRDEKAVHGGVLLKSTPIFADSGSALVTMLKVGQVKPGELGL